MSERTSIHDRNRDSRLFLGRAVLAAVVVLAMTLVLVGRMTHLQIVNHQHYSTLSQQNRVRTVPVPPTRGLIYDRNGVLLAENTPSFRLVITPEQVKDLDDTIERLGQLIELRDADITRFREAQRRQRRFEEVPLKLRLTEEEIARLAIDRHRFPGVEVRAQLTRHYPQGEHAVHAIGYVGRINAQDLTRLNSTNYRGSTHTGKTGIERYYEEILHGQIGVEQVETNALGRVIRTISRTEPERGTDIYLTLDIALQRAAEQALGEHTGSIVAIAPATGEVLAFVSKPMYDPNLFVNGIDVEDFRLLQSDYDRPLFNRALRGQYPPGSTLKPIIAMAGLEHGTITAEDTILCQGYYTLPDVDHRYRCWNRTGHGWQNVTDAIVESNDVYFYDLGYRLGIDAMSAFLAPFGIGSRTGIDLNGELSGILPSREWKRRSRNEAWFHGETLITAIGQGFMLTTPLQLAQATAIIANRGQPVTPRLLLATQPSNGERVATDPSYGEPIRLNNEQRWDQIIEAMRLSVHGPRGTARSISRGIGYQIAGKTGTSQVFTIAQDERYDAEQLARRLHNHALFVAFAPVENPQIALAVLVEHGGGGGTVAAPIAREVLDAYLNKDRGDAP